MADTSFNSNSEDANGCMMMSIDTSAELDSSMSTIVQTPASQMSPASSSRLALKKQLEPTLTPATMSSAGSSPSLSSPYIGNSSVKMLSMGNLMSDRPSTISVRTGIPSQQHKQQSQRRHDQFLEQSSQTQSIWVPLPSPSKPRLDPRYAARLAPSVRNGCPKAPPTCVPISNNSIPSSEGDLMPPPSVTRNSGIFRPPPISAPPFCAEEMQQPLHYFTPSSGLPSPHFFSSSTRCSSTASDVSLSTFSPSTNIISTPIRPSKRSKADIGVSDRFIPNRGTSNFNFNLWEGVSRRSNSMGQHNNGSCRDSDDRNSNNNSNNANDSSSADSNTNGGGNSLNTVSNSSRGLLSTLLRSELLGENENPMASSTYGNGGQQRHGSRGGGAPLREGVANHLRFRSPRQEYQDSLFEDAIGPTAIVNSFSLTPIGSAASQRLMAVPPKRKRRISKVPFKVLDAPALQDDFYLNLVDWSSQNVLAVGLGSCVYLWSACTSKVTKLCDLASSEDIVTSVSWAQRGTHLSVGTNRGEVQLWDTIKCKKVRSLAGHTARVGTLAWTGPILASGSRDRLIYLRDVRVQAAYTDKLTNHKQEVCGLKWSYEEPSFLASGGNDNNLHVIDSRHPSEPLHKFSEHNAAVKAIAWSPHQHGLLASGGGTADRCIRFWNTLSGSSLNKIDTGSQVCNLAWSQNCNEIVSTHGYSLNQIVVWRYPSMSKVTTLTGHTYRVLYLAMSPDGSTIVTGAGDETLRFWQIFPGPRSDGKDSSGGLLFPNTLGSVIR